MLSPNHYLDLADGKFNQTNAADLTTLFDSLERAAAKDHLVVHFHGGLVSRATAELAAEGLMPYYEEGRAYPVFFFWHSDLWTTLTRNLDQIAQEPIFKRLVKRLVQLALGKLSSFAGARVGGPLPLESEDALPDDLHELAQYAAQREPAGSKVKGVTLTNAQIDQATVELETDEIIQAESRALAVSVAPPAMGADVRARSASGGAVTPRRTLMSKSVLDELAQEQHAPGARIGGLMTFTTLVIRGVIVLKRLIGRFAERRDHGLYTTIVEEILRELYIDSIGALAWAMMKKDTLDAFGTDPQVYGGTAFLKHLKAWWHPGRRITLIGHSTGAIYIGHMLEHADPLLDPTARFNVVFLAPACSFEFMASKLPVFTRRVDRLRMFGLKDELERGYWEVPVLYPASLLYMVSGLFEEPASDMPIVGMQRYFSGAEPYLTPEIQEVTSYLQGKSVWALAHGEPGLFTSANKHGSFDEDLHTRESLREFLRAAKGN
jgi:hypothetical protein